MTTLIIGGAGFIGTNLAKSLLEDGERVVVFDSLARGGVERNLRFLRESYPDLLTFISGDVRDRPALRLALVGVGRVVHLAAQVAVTTSLQDPTEDFEVNAHGTLNVLEEIRRLENPPSLLFTSTNKVYGSLEDISLVERGERWEPADPRLRASGIAEDRPLDFHSPYGCSKGAADQYVLDYARTFGLCASVFRMSCIYGPHQFGTEDQGWVAHFLIRAREGQPITLYGDGHQVRDILFVEDLIRAMRLAQTGAARLSGRAYDIGGGPANAVSLLEVIGKIEKELGRSVEIEWGPWRPGDQKYYVTNPGAFTEETGWRPRTSPDEGIARLGAWLTQHLGEAVLH